MQPRLHPINPKPRGHFRLALKGTICLGLNRKKFEKFPNLTSLHFHTFGSGTIQRNCS
jgi:hypothetical protein